MAGGGGDSRWLVSYADLVTLLMAFFVALYGISQSDSAKFKAFLWGLGPFGNEAAVGTGVLDGTESILGTGSGAQTAIQTGSGSGTQLAGSTGGAGTGTGTGTGTG